MHAESTLREAPTRVVHGACPHDCPDTCAMRVTVQGGRVVRIQGDPDHDDDAGRAVHQGLALCRAQLPRRARAASAASASAPRAAGASSRCRWDEALGDIAQRLQAIAARDAQAILPYSYAGTMGLLQGEGMAARFFHKLGASLLDRTICSSAGGEALVATYGAKVGMHMRFFGESRLIVIWGSNSIASNLHFWTLAQQAKRAGAKLVCIDPRRTETADKCHQHIALLPGTDGALALGVMHELITTDCLDHDYIERHVEGFRGAARARAGVAARARRGGLRHLRRRSARPGARPGDDRSRPRSASTTACSACTAAAMRRA